MQDVTNLRKMNKILIAEKDRNDFRKKKMWGDEEGWNRINQLYVPIVKEN